MNIFYSRFYYIRFILFSDCPCVPFMLLYLCSGSVRFQVEVFRVVTPCGVLVGYQRFRGPCCLHLRGEVASSQSHFTTDCQSANQFVLASNPRSRESYGFVCHGASFTRGRIYLTIGHSPNLC